MVAFGRPFIANPDLVARFENDLELAQPDFNKLYTPGADGYGYKQGTSFSAPQAAGVASLMLALFALSFWSTLKPGGMTKRPWLLKWALWMLPAPWIACELGWFVAEYGRQPWTIYGVLPTHLSVSTLSVGSLYGSLAGFIGFYTLLLIVEMYLMVKFARIGPGSLGTGRYEREPVHHAVQHA